MTLHARYACLHPRTKKWAEDSGGECSPHFVGLEWAPLPESPADSLRGWAQMPICPFSQVSLLKEGRDTSETGLKPGVPINLGKDFLF